MNILDEDISAPERERLHDYKIHFRQVGVEIGRSGMKDREEILPAIRIDLPKEPMKKVDKQLVSEVVGGEPYDYYSIGRHIVVAPGVCGGRPTFKYTRIDVRHALSLLALGRTVERVAQGYEIPVAAVQEALALAGKAFDQSTRELSRKQAEGA